MPQFAPVVIKDTAEVAHTYNPDSITGGVATLVESTGVPIGDKRITISSTKTQGDRRKLTFKFSFPVVQDATVNGVVKPTVVRTAYADVVFSFSGDSSLKERGDAADLVSNFFYLKEHALAAALIKNLEGLY